MYHPPQSNTQQSSSYLDVGPVITSPADYNYAGVRIPRPRTFAYLNDSMLEAHQKSDATETPPLFRPGGNHLDRAPESVNKVMSGRHYLLYEIQPGSLPVWKEFTNSPGYYYEEDPQGATALSKQDIQTLESSRAVFVKTLEMPTAQSQYLERHQPSNEQTLPSLSEATTGYTTSPSAQVEAQTARPPKRRADDVNETPTDNYYQESIRPHKATRRRKTRITNQTPCHPQLSHSSCGPVQLPPLLPLFETTGNFSNQRSSRDSGEDALPPHEPSLGTISDDPSRRQSTYQSWEFEYEGLLSSDADAAPKQMEYTGGLPPLLPEPYPISQPFPPSEAFSPS